MLSRKALKVVCHPTIWSTFSFCNRDTSYPFNYRGRQDFYALERRFERYGTADIKYLKNFGVGDEIFASDLASYPYRFVNEIKLFMTILDEVRNGNTPNLKLVRLHLESSGMLFNSCFFCSLIKLHINSNYLGSLKSIDFIFDSSDQSGITSINARKEFLTFIKQYSEPLPPQNSHYSSQFTFAKFSSISAILQN